MQPKVSVSPAALADIDLLVPLFDAYRRFYEAGSDPDGARRFLSERLSKGDSRIFLAFRETGEGRIAAGFTQLYPSFSSLSMKRLWILNDLFVRPELRRTGVGEALMERAREFASADGAKGLTLATQAQNETAQALYAKMGYRMDTQFRHYHLYF